LENNQVTTDPIQELEILFPDNYLETKDGQKIEVIDFPFHFWFKAISLFNKRTEFFTNALSGGEILPLITANDGEILNDLATLVLGACPGLTREGLDKMRGSDVMTLFFKVIQVNRDFFVQATREGTAILAGTVEDTPRSPSDSLATDTDTTTSDFTDSEK
jgi:hypothetical protein